MLSMTLYLRPLLMNGGEEMQEIQPKELPKLIPNGAGIVLGGFVGCGFPDILAFEIEKSFLEKGTPRDLAIFFAAGQGDAQKKGLNHLGHEGLLRFALGSHFGLAPRLVELILSEKIEAYSFPQGVIAHLFRAASAKEPCILTKIGLGTFVDPRIACGCLNGSSRKRLVEVFELEGNEYLMYKTKPLQGVKIALLRGTTADRLGNISMEKEALLADAPQVATMVHNNGGLVIIQVERIAEAGSLHPQMVKIPGQLVDYIVVCKDQWQTFGEVYNPGYSGEIRVPPSDFPSMPLDAKKVIGKRAARELKKGMVVNIGIGSVPESIAAVLAEEGLFQDLILTVESGIIGGIPSGGLSFGASLNPWAIIDQPSQFDFYDGGGLDCACLGFAEGDEQGNVNVSRFGGRIPGPGGFINISQSAKKVVFCGTFTAGSELEIKGKLHILKEGATKKFLKHLHHITFSGDYALKAGHEVIFVTERAVFQLTKDGLELIEVARGIDVERDILKNMEFIPIVRSPKEMDPSLFRKE